MIRTLFLAVVVVSALVLSFYSPQNEDSTQVENVSTNQVIQPCDVEVDEVDEGVFHYVSETYQLFEQQAGELWNEQFRFDQMPMLLVRLGDGFSNEYGLMFNYTHPEQIDGACLLTQAEQWGLSNVYRTTALDEAQLEEFRSFAFEFDAYGVSSLMFRYSGGRAIFASPTSYDWVNFIVHEGLHRDQRLRWNRIESGIEPDTYTQDIENVELMLLEHTLLRHALETSSQDEKHETLKQFAAVRLHRLSRWPDVMLDLRGEQIEGTGRYMERKIIEAFNFTETRLSPTTDYLQLLSGDNFVVGTLGGHPLGIYYMGAAQGLLMDELDIEWTSAVEGGLSPSQVIANYYGLDESNIDSLLESAKAEHNFEQLTVYVDMIQNQQVSPLDIEEVYQTPELGTAALGVSDDHLPEEYEVAGGFSLNAEDILESERPYYSPDGETVDVLVFSDSFDRQIRLHVSPTQYASFDEWYEAVDARHRLPLISVRQIGKATVGVTFGVNPSLILINNSNFIHIKGRLSLDEKLQLALNWKPASS